MLYSDRRQFLQQAAFLSTGAIIGPELSWMSRKPVPDLPRATPESTGVSSEAIIQYLTEANQCGLEHHGFMLLRQGKVISEAYWKPFERNQVHTLYSLSKSFTSTAIGFAVQEGKIKLTDKVISFFPEHLPGTISENLAKMEIRHVLNMATGHTKDTMPVMRAAQGVSWIKSFLACPVEKEPGTHFLYNTGASYFCSAIITKMSGQTLQEYLGPRLYLPLGITQSDWELSPEGINTGGYGLRVTADDIARFGQFYLQKGKWESKSLIGEAWVEEATTSHIKSNPGDGDWSQGYGYQFWRCKPGFYRGDGAFGQYCVVMPQYDAVIALTSESSDMQKQMTLMWNHLLPGMKDQPLSENRIRQEELTALSKGLSLPAQLGSNGGPLVNRIKGKSFILDENPWAWKSMMISAGNKGGYLLLEGDRGRLEIPFSWNDWLVNDHRIQNPFNNPNQIPVGSRVASTAGCDPNGNLKIRLKYTEGIHGDLLTFTSENEKEIDLNLLYSMSEKNPNNKDNRAGLKGRLPA